MECSIAFLSRKIIHFDFMFSKCVFTGLKFCRHSCCLLIYNLNQNGRSLEFHKIQLVCHLDILWNHWNIDVLFFLITIFTVKINTYFHIPSCDYSVIVCKYICSGKGFQRLGICIAMNSLNQCIQLDKLK